MPKINVKLFGREYPMNCEEGQEKRLMQIAAMVDEKMKEVSGKAGNTTETHVFMLTCMMMADELLDLRNDVEKTQKQEEDILVAAVGLLREKVAHLVSEGGRA